MSVSHLQAWAKIEASELIKKYDRNGDGVLTKEELQSFLHDARLKNIRFVSSSTIPKTNENLDQKVSSNTRIKPKKQLLDKAQDSLRQSNVPLSREQIKEIFKYHDSNKDGFLSIRELTKAFGSLGSIVPFAKARHAMAYADVDEDGLISEAELHKLIDYAEKIIKKK
ncbi:putative calcium-binding protein CML11 [Cucumis melo var. makuwa]|uniref:Calcium-binding protein CML11 n=2 Tax=Cucumis melo TaxID=3656 RepID=A0A5A7V4R9_CUCMM|nr:probable calcium-binding protein CML11 [Cucumis melo]KAA0060885.1 putative calcium-binding protein CML11 [Cucumis melo var. makuwa]